MTPSPESAISRERPLRILVRATNWIGDSVMTMPAIQRLREWQPHAHISLLCSAKLETLWRHNPFLTEVIVFDRHPDLRALRAREFDLAVILPNSFRSAWECWRAGIPRRVGFAGRWRRQLLTEVVPGSRSELPEHRSVTVDGKTFRIKSFRTVRHQAHRYLDLISQLGGNREPAIPKLRFAVEELPPLTRFFHDDGRPVAGLNAGAEYGPAKRWMPERFAEVARQLALETDCRWVLFGGPRDAEIAHRIERQLQTAGLAPGSVINVAGKTTLLELCTLLRCCTVMLTNDTGPMHLAAALGTPVVVVIGSTSPDLTGPLGPHHTVIRQPVECSPCFLRECPIDFRCMERIAVEPVVEAVRRQLQRAGPPILRTGPAGPAVVPARPNP